MAIETLTAPTCRVEQVPLDSEPDPGIRLLLTWYRAVGGGEPPPRRLIDAATFAPVVGAVSLVHWEAGRWRFGLTAQFVLQAESNPSDPEYLDQLEPAPYRALVKEAYDAVRVGRTPSLSRVTFLSSRMEDSYRRLALPLADPDGSINTLLVYNADSLDRARRRRMGLAYRAYRDEVLRGRP
ncbi:MAG: hypothetical protein EAZ99_14255 [Alphaproteobacteria bacterium]|nr:MAG: hypothetical protein EAZ99_14255 [Alphaproteobacteria bacterium]